MPVFDTAEFMQMMNIRQCLLILFVLLAGSPPLAAETLVSLESRPSVAQSFLLLEAAHPVANVILFAGGHGNLHLAGDVSQPTIGWGKNNFLVRTRN